MNADVFSADWDVIVIGTGVGGGTIGRRLAEAGKRVLFVEKGPKGHRTEEQGLDPMMGDPVSRHIRGYWPKPVELTQDGRRTEVFAPLGAGLGGSSVFYAATLERPEPHDLTDTAERPHPTQGWPVGFDAMAPYFGKAQTLYAIRGTADPLSAHEDTLADPAPLTDLDAAIMDKLRAGGQHPYHAHSAIAQPDGCLSCLGRKCPRPCKMDGRSAGVEPALATGRAGLLTDAPVQRLVMEGSRVSGVEVRTPDGLRTLTAPTVIVSAGALSSPRLLLASASEGHASGVGNANDLVGRNLMFHLTEMLAVWPGRGITGGPSKSVALRDLYHDGATRMGMVQSMGIDAGYGEILYFMGLQAERSGFGALKPFLRLPAAVAQKAFGQAKIFAGILEDLPYAENRVLPGETEDDIRIEYRMSDELKARRKQFRKGMKRAFRQMRTFFLNRAPDLNLGHPCGSLRFGMDPKTSVLDANCRVHGIENLFVVDASFMPTSLGVNPSLTIAANALRVGDHILEARP